jgi:DNA-directed RNA polymerase subunit RPC12/RpoP
VADQATGVLQEPAREIKDTHASAETFGITCTNCGGSLRIHEGERSIRCEYCGCALLVTRPKGVPSYILEPRISAGKARFAALKYLSTETKGRVKARHTAIMDLNLINVPFWRMNGRLAGWMSGNEIIRHKVEVPVPGPNGTKMVTRIEEEKNPFSKIVFKQVEWSTPACVLRHLGLQGISLRTQFLDWDLFDYRIKEKLNVALPMKTALQAEKDGYNYLTTLTAPSGAMVKASRFELLGNKLSLYYYPVYILRYRHGDSIYSITIDGVDGHIIRGDTPTYRKMSLGSVFFVPAAAAVLTTVWFPLLPIAAVLLYAFDSVRSGGPIRIDRWAAERLDGWFGGRL